MPLTLTSKVDFDFCLDFYCLLFTLTLTWNATLPLPRTILKNGFAMTVMRMYIFKLPIKIYLKIYLEDCHLKSELDANLSNFFSNSKKKKLLNSVMNQENINIRIIIKIKLGLIYP